MRGFWNRQWPAIVAVLGMIGVMASLFFLIKPVTANGVIESQPYYVPVSDKSGRIYYFLHSRYDPQLIFCVESTRNEQKVVLNCIGRDVDSVLTKMDVTLKISEARL